LDPMVYLQPFLSVIHSNETSGPITGVALSSVDKFLTCGFLKHASPYAARTIKKITDTVIHCRFEVTNMESDDVVLMKILRVLLSCLSCSAGRLLSDDTVFEMLNVCYRLSKGRISELLKKIAERTFMEIVHIVFLVNNIHNASYWDEPNSDLKVINSLPAISPASPTQLLHETLSTPRLDTGRTNSFDYINPRGVRFRSESSVESDGVVVEHVPKPYGQECLIKIFGFLVSLTSLDESIPESLRQMSIQLITTIVETQPQLIERIPAILGTLSNDLCKNLLAHLTCDNLDRLNFTLRLFFNLYVSLKVHLKVQLEVFFNNLLLFIYKSPKQVSFEKQELALEHLVQFFYQPNFITELYANYDCNSHGTNIFEQLSTFLYKTSFPINGVMYSVQQLALESLLAIVETQANRSNNSPNKENSVNAAIEILRTQKAGKAKLFEAAEKFNKKPSEGLKFLSENNLIDPSLDNASVARFLRTCPGIDKKVSGEYISKQDKEFVNAFVATFDFRDLEFIRAFRIFLTAFFMCGEAQVIDRIIESFAHHWVTQNPSCTIFASRDVAYIVCFSVVMLNVDAHNLGVKTKMTEDEYIQRLRGINEGQDLPREYLSAIYHDITKNEIKIVDDTPSGAITDDRWPAILLRTQQLGAFIQPSPHDLDKDVFLLVWRSIIAAFSAVYEAADNGEILESVLEGFKNCSVIAAYFKQTPVFDNIIINLCKFTTLMTLSSVPKRAIIFGKDKKAQTTATFMFGLILQYGHHLREAWRNVLRSIISLNEMNLLNDLIEDDSAFIVEGRKKVKPVKTPNESAGSGLLSFIPGWWNTPAEEEINQADIDAEAAAKKCTQDCSIKALIDGTKNLQAESLMYFIKALILESSQPKPGQEFNQSSACFCLDLLTEITLVNHDRIRFVWVLVSEHFTGIVQLAKQPSEFVEKAIVCLLLLCVKLVSKSEVHSGIISSLELFLKLESSVAQAMAESIIIAVSKLLEACSSSIQSTEGWKVILALVEKSAQYSIACERGFSTLLNLLDITSNPPSGVILHPDAFHPYLHAVLAYVNVIDNRARTERTTQSTAIRSMNLLYSLFEGVSRISENKSLLAILSQINPAIDHWKFYWLPIFQSLIRLCRDPRNDVRTHAMTLMQRTLLSPQIQALPPESLRTCFEEVMFPLLTDLLKPFPNATSDNMLLTVEETRVRAITLLSKSLLQYLHHLTQLPDFHTKLWPKILESIEQYMKADRSSLLKEAIPETLKNILLVMLEMNIFHSGNTINGVDIWTLTWHTIDSFCPSLKQDESFRSSLSAFRLDLLYNIPAHVQLDERTSAVYSPSSPGLVRNLPSNHANPNLPRDLNHTVSKSDPTLNAPVPKLSQ